jgi:hypothetical protein
LESKKVVECDISSKDKRFAIAGEDNINQPLAKDPFLNLDSANPKNNQQE